MPKLVETSSTSVGTNTSASIRSASQDSVNTKHSKASSRFSFISKLSIRSSKTLKLDTVKKSLKDSIKKLVRKKPASDETPYSDEVQVDDEENMDQSGLSKSEKKLRVFSVPGTNSAELHTLAYPRRWFEATDKPRAILSAEILGSYRDFTRELLLFLERLTFVLNELQRCINEHPESDKELSPIFMHLENIKTHCGVLHCVSQEEKQPRIDDNFVFDITKSVFKATGAYFDDVFGPSSLLQRLKDKAPAGLDIETLEKDLRNPLILLINLRFFVTRLSMKNRHRLTEPGQASRQNEGILLNASELMSQIYTTFGQKDFYDEAVNFEFEVLDITNCHDYNYDLCASSTSAKKGGQFLTIFTHLTFPVKLDKYDVLPSIPSIVTSLQVFVVNTADVGSRFPNMTHTYKMKKEDEDKSGQKIIVPKKSAVCLELILMSDTILILEINNKSLKKSLLYPPFPLVNLNVDWLETVKNCLELKIEGSLMLSLTASTDELRGFYVCLMLRKDNMHALKEAQMVSMRNDIPLYVSGQPRIQNTDFKLAAKYLALDMQGQSPVKPARQLPQAVHPLFTGKCDLVCEVKAKKFKLENCEVQVYNAMGEAYIQVSLESKALLAKERLTYSSKPRLEDGRNVLKVYLKSLTLVMQRFAFRFEILEDAQSCEKCLNQAIQAWVQTTILRHKKSFTVSVPPSIHDSSFPVISEDLLGYVDDTNIIEAVNQDSFDPKRLTVDQLLRVKFTDLTLNIDGESFLLGPVVLTVDILKASDFLISSLVKLRSCFPGTPLIASLNLSDVVVSRYKETSRAGIILNVDNDKTIARLALIGPDNFDAELLYTQFQKIQTEVDILAAEKTTYTREREVLIERVKKAIQEAEKKKIEHDLRVAEEEEAARIAAEEAAKMRLQDEEDLLLQRSQEQNCDELKQEVMDALVDEIKLSPEPDLIVSETIPLAEPTLECHLTQKVSETTLLEGEQEQQEDAIHGENVGLDVNKEPMKEVRKASIMDPEEFEPLVLRAIENAQKRAEASDCVKKQEKTRKNISRLTRLFDYYKAQFSSLAQQKEESMEHRKAFIEGVQLNRAMREEQARMVAGS